MTYFVLEDQTGMVVKFAVELSRQEVLMLYKKVERVDCCHVAIDLYRAACKRRQVKFSYQQLN